MGSYEKEIMGASGAASVTPANNNLPDFAAKGATKALLIGSPGTLNVMMESGETVTGLPVLAGYNPLRVRQVRTGGTAGTIFALYST